MEPDDLATTFTFATLMKPEEPVANNGCTLMSPR